VAHFDRAVSPGGEGKITLTVNLKGYQGQVWKTATVVSNDPQNPSLTLSLHGRIRPAIEVLPSSSLIFHGTAEENNGKVIDLKTTSRPFQILRVTNTLEGKITYQLETIVKNRHYRLKILNRQKTGKFTGMLKFFTSHPKHPEIGIPVYLNLNG
jgi:hypothetical protein